MTFDKEIIDELSEIYNKVKQEDGKVDRTNVGEVFKQFGEGVAQFKLRDVCEKLKIEPKDPISFETFLSVAGMVDLIKTKSRGFKQNISAKTDVQQVSGYETTSSDTMHMVTNAERASFSNFISTQLADDPDCKAYLPLNPETDDLFKKLSDGVLLCKLVNVAVPNTIDERAICKKKISAFTATENVTMALNSTKGIGLHIVNIGSEDIKEGRVHLCLGVLWQLIRKYYLSALNLIITPDLLCLLREGETADDLRALSAEELLLRWVEYQVRKTGFEGPVPNLGSALADSVIYSHLQEAIMPDKMIHSAADIRSCGDKTQRAKMVIDNSTNARIAKLVSPFDITSGNVKLNTLYVADMYNKYPCLKPVEAPPEIVETREEKSYRNWMNSLGVNPSVSYLYANLSNGLVLLQLCEIIWPKSVNQSKVNRPPFKANQAMLKKTENCNMVVEIAKKHNLSVVGLSGKNIEECSPIHVLGLVWQLMRMYTLQMLSRLSGSEKPLADAEIIAWVNGKYKEAGKSVQISSFKDTSIQTSHPILHLIEAIKAGSVDWSIEKMQNAKLSISLARKIGATVYALPEDIVEGKFKMVMTVFACLMASAYVC